MAAPLGYKDFIAGDPLTAAQVDGYLMAQSVMTFASAAARTSAYPTASEGNLCYLADTNSFEIYDGATWVAYGSGDITGVTAGFGLTGGGASGAVTLTVDNTTILTTTNSVTATNKTFTSPVINTATIADGVMRGLEEDVNVVASAATGTINLNVETASIWYYTTNASANHTLNIRYSSTVSLNTALAVGDAITVVWMNTNGTTAYYPNVIQIDGTTVTPKIQGGTAIAAGNASSIDVYVFTIVKTAATPTYVVFESQTKFA